MRSDSVGGLPTSTTIGAVLLIVTAGTTVLRSLQSALESGRWAPTSVDGSRDVGKALMCLATDDCADVANAEAVVRRALGFQGAAGQRKPSRQRCEQLAGAVDVARLPERAAVEARSSGGGEIDGVLLLGSDTVGGRLALDLWKALPRLLTIGGDRLMPIEVESVSGLKREEADFVAPTRWLVEYLLKLQDDGPFEVIGAGGFKTLTLIASAAAAALGAPYWQLNGKLLVAPPLPMRFDEDAVALDVGERDSTLMATVRGAARAWAALPEVERMARRGQALPAAVSTAEVRERMTARTRRWWDADVWSGDRIPQMMHHGRRHAANVDRHATTLLAHSRLGATASTSAFEMISAAAWLHDIGHLGATLGGEYINDYQHVRKTHGLLTDVLLNDRERQRELFGCGDDHEGLPSREVALAEATGLVCAHHQRFTRLREHETQRYKRCGGACRACAAAATYSVSPLRSRAKQKYYLEEQLKVSPDQLVVLAAILRVADAMDLGIHRSSARRELAFGHLEDAWLRDAAQNLLAVVRSVRIKAADTSLAALGAAQEELEWYLANGCPGAAAKQVDEKLKAAGFEQEAKAFSDYRTFIKNQAFYQELHAHFSGSRLVQIDDLSYRVELYPSKTPNRSRDDFIDDGLDDADALAPEFLAGRNWTLEECAEEYVRSEYNGVRDIFDSEGLRMTFAVVKE